MKFFSGKARTSSRIVECGLAIVCLFMLSTAAFAQLPNPTYGWNLGNTMESTCGVGCWAPAPTQALINSVANAGFNTIRIPCAWDTHANQSTYQIDSTYMAQVKQLVDWCYARGMYVVINDHWDDGWLQSNLTGTYNPTTNAKVKSYWTQIANTFAGYDNHLLFACSNEPTASTSAQISELFAYYQTFLNTIRGTGGNNSSRWLVIQGPNTNIDQSYSMTNTLPSDPTPGRLMFEVHYYDPFQFALMESDASWGNMFYFWGQAYHSTTMTSRNATWGEESYVDAEFAKMQSKFVNNGIPVLLGEFGTVRRNGYSDLTGANLSLHLASRTYFDKYIVSSANSHGMRPCYWDEGRPVESNGFGIFDRNTAALVNTDDGRALTGGPALPPPGSNLVANGTYTIVGIQSGSALDDPGWSTTSGQQQDIWAVNGGTNQKWTLTNLGNNVVELVNNVSNMALEVRGNSTSNGAAVDQAPYTGANNQKWTVVKVSTGVYNLKNVNSGQMLDVIGAKTANGTLVDQWPSNGGTNQQWKFQ